MFPVPSRPAIMTTGDEPRFRNTEMRPAATRCPQGPSAGEADQSPYNPVAKGKSSVFSSYPADCSPMLLWFSVVTTSDIVIARARFAHRPGLSYESARSRWPCLWPSSTLGILPCIRRVAKQQDHELSDQVRALSR
jgi:hypothetical protein